MTRLTAADLREWPTTSFGTTGWLLDRDTMDDAIAHAGPGYFVLHPEQWYDPVAHPWVGDFVAAMIAEDATALVSYDPMPTCLDAGISQINAGADWHGRYVGERETVAIVSARR